MIDIQKTIKTINKYMADNNIQVTRNMLSDIQVNKVITSSIIDKEIRKLNLNFI
jgi:hypothetical protein